MTDDLHTPTNAGPDPGASSDPSANPFGDPSATPAPAARSYDGGTAATSAPRPEVMVAAAFAGGLIVARILKRLGR
jgi:hypothetical protein